MSGDFQRQIARKCKLSSLLNPPYKEYRQEIRKIAEEYSILRRDAMNLALYSVCFWAETGYHDDPNVFPQVLSHTFWSHCYRSVALGEGYVLRTEFDPCIRDRFPTFDMYRKNPSTGYYLYDIPTLDEMHGVLATEFTVDIITNVGLHLTRNVRRNIFSVFKGFFLQYANQFTLSLAISKLANAATDSILNSQLEFSTEINLLPIAQEFYRIVQSVYNTAFGNLSIDIIRSYEFAHHNSQNLLYFSSELLKVATNFIQMPFEFKKWSILPVAQHGIVHVPLSGFALIYNLLRRCAKAGYNIPKEFLIQETDYETNQHHFKLIGRKQFKTYYADDACKEFIWETLFNLDHIQKNRQRVSNSPVVNRTKNKIQLNYGIRSDGHMVSVLFSSTSKEHLPEVKDDIQMAPRKLNLENWERGLYCLKKEPIGLASNDIVIGIDPGFRSMVTAVDTSHENITDKSSSKAHSVSISNGDYRVRSGFAWRTQVELNKRIQYGSNGIQHWYDAIPSPKVIDCSVFLNYVLSISVVHNHVFTFMKTFEHRELKGYMYSNSRQTLDYITNLLTGKTIKSEGFMLCHKSNRKQRQKMKKENRQQLGFQANHENKFVFAYGDASIRSSMKSFGPNPSKKLRTALSKKALVILIDEYKTSAICSHCKLDLSNIDVSGRNFNCNHSKKKSRLFNEKNTTKKCINIVEGVKSILGRTSDCPLRTRQNYPAIAYPLKLCRQCLAGSYTDRNLVWNRDINAALNIRSVLVDYVNSGYDINSRHAALSRVVEQPL